MQCNDISIITESYSSPVISPLFSGEGWRVDETERQAKEGSAEMMEQERGLGRKEL